jgi:hypothetical protein
MSAPGSEGRPPSEEELAEALAEQIRSLRVEQLVASALQTLLAVGFGRLEGEGGAPPDLRQAELAVETIRAPLPVAGRFAPPAAIAELRGALAELQLAYAAAARRTGGAPSATGQPPPGPGQPPPGPPQPPPRTRPTIWTPGGER